MSLSDELPDSASLRAYFAGLPRFAREAGAAIAATGRFGSLSVSDDGTRIEAMTSGTPRVLAQVRWANGSWRPFCTCRRNVCEHVAAVVVAAIDGFDAATKSAREGLEQSPLATGLAAARGRPLTAQELRFVKLIRSVYAMSRRQGVFTSEHWAALGFPALGWSYNTQTLDLWPEMPVDDHEFWLYVCREAKNRGLQIPDILAPVSDLAAIESKIRIHERRRDIEVWQAVLHRAAAADVETAAAREVQLEIRIRLRDGAGVLERRDARKGRFIAVKRGELEELRDELSTGRSGLAPAAERMLALVLARPLGTSGAELQQESDDDQALLARFIADPASLPFIVDVKGKPLRHADRPARWTCRPAGGDDDDYVFRLVDAEGRPLDNGMVFRSRAFSAVVRDEVVHRFQDPAMTVLDPVRETRIPAAALETSGGFALVKRLGVETPGRLAARVREEKTEATIRCTLRRYADDSEVLLVELRVKSADGKIDLHWCGRDWRPTTSEGGATQVVGDSGDAVVYERAPIVAAVRHLSRLHLEWTPPEPRGRLALTLDFPEVFHEWVVSTPPGVMLELDPDLAALRDRPVIDARFKVHVAPSNIDWFDVRTSVEVSDTTLTEDEIALLLEAKGSFVRISGKGWRRIDYSAASSADEEAMARLGLDVREGLGEVQRLHALQLADDAARLILSEEQFAAVRRRAEEIKTRVQPPVPETVTATLRPYQIDGFHFLAYLAENSFGGILADDMGLGKTLQTLTWIAWLFAARRDKGSVCPPVLIVCPKSDADNWRAETERFAPSFRLHVWRSSDLGEFPTPSEPVDIHVVNYHQLRRVDAEARAIKWLAVVLDEGQFIKNPTSTTAQVARSLEAEHRLVLSGTPIENRLLDLWSLMAFSMPGVLGSRAGFTRGFDPKKDEHALRRLSARVRPFLLRRTKAQVAADLPDRVEEDLFCEMEGEQKSLYQAELKHARQILTGLETPEELQKKRFSVLTSLLRLRQICCHPGLVRETSKTAGAKIDALLDHLGPLIAEGHKVLVFSQFASLFPKIEPAIRELEAPVFVLTGETENRGELIAEFQATEGAAIFLLSLKAAGFGLNLTAASYVVLFDPWWNPAVENQAIDRTHRIGQTRTVVAHRLLIKDSIEEKIRELQRKKTALATDVLGEERFAQALTVDDLRYLFSE